VTCSCPDWAVMCKHVCAALYGLGVRLDEQPELLFRLRKVDHMDLVCGVGVGASAGKVTTGAGARVLDTDDICGVLGIDIEDAKPHRRCNRTRQGDDIEVIS